MKRNDIRTDHIPLVISACVLHNLCEIHGESFNDRWIEDEYQQPTTVTLPTSPSNSAQDIRNNTLVQYFHTQQQQ